MCYTPETECNLMKGYTYGVLFSTWQKCVSILMYTVKPVSRGHLWDKKSGLIRQVTSQRMFHFIWKFLWQNKKKMSFQCKWLLNRGDHMATFDCILLFWQDPKCTSSSVELKQTLSVVFDTSYHKSGRQGLLTFCRITRRKIVES